MAAQRQHHHQHDLQQQRPQQAPPQERQSKRRQRSDAKNHYPGVSVGTNTNNNHNATSSSLFPAPSLSTIIDEQFVITKTAATSALCRRTGKSPLRRSSVRRRQNKTRVLLDQIDGITCNEEAKKFVTSRRYPRGVYIRKTPTSSSSLSNPSLHHRPTSSSSSASSFEDEQLQQQQELSAGPVATSSPVLPPFELIVAEGAFEQWEEVEEQETTIGIEQEPVEIATAKAALSPSSSTRNFIMMMRGSRGRSRGTRGRNIPTSNNNINDNRKRCRRTRSTSPQP